MQSEIKNDGKRLEVTRIFNAPRAQVFGWWADAAKLQQWSKCKEATRCEVTMDFRVGGSFIQHMCLAVHGETCEFTITATYTEIVEAERIAYNAQFGPVPVQVAVRFSDVAKGTKVVVTHEGLPDEFFGQNISRGTEESFDQLETLVQSVAVAV
jgi:uncharacterized protein YndB with AHSA1/START domain